MSTSTTQRQARKLDQAARAAWLYYIAGNTQDEIANKLCVSRQAAQRMVALATSEHLIKFRLDHPLGACIELAEQLRDRFDLQCCEVAPSDPATDGSVSGVAILAAEQLEHYLSTRTPIVLAFGTGRTLRAAVSQVSSMKQPQHKIVSLVGNMTRDGRASPFDVVMRLADRVGAQCYPMPTPVIADSAHERELLQTQRSFQTVRDLATQARVVFAGISEVTWNGPLHQDGFVTDSEIAELIEQGGIGEMFGWVFDRQGRLIAGASNERVAGMPLEQPVRRLTIGVACGRRKVAAITAALQGCLISGLITDELSAQQILK